MLTGYLQLNRKKLKYAAIFIPNANLGRAFKLEYRLKDQLHKQISIDWFRTECVGHAKQIAHSCAESNYERVIALGGDGTVHEVINGLLKSKKQCLPSLGIIPVGSGNDFAFSLGISNNPFIALNQSLYQKTFPTDIGFIQNSDQQIEYWSNAVGIGFDANVVIYTKEMKKLKGFILYLAAVLKTLFKNHTVINIEATIDGETINDNFLMFSLCNGIREGGGFYLAPDAKQDDGLLNYVSLSYVSKLKLLTSLPKFLNGTHIKLDHVATGHFRNVKIRSNSNLIIHTDGEIYATDKSNTKEIYIGIIPEKIHVVKISK